MQEVKLHIANSSGALTPYLKMIRREFEAAREIAEKTIDAHSVDIVVNDRPERTYPTLGTGGDALTSKLIIVSLYVNKPIEPIDLRGTMLHELHHAMRFKALRLEWPKMTLFDYLVLEGLGTLYEEECTGRKPDYAKAKIKDKTKALAKRHFQDIDFDTDEWFMGSSMKIEAWFGYVYGNQIARAASLHYGKTAAEMVSLRTEKFLKFA